MSNQPVTTRGEERQCPQCGCMAPVHTHRNAKRAVFTNHYDPRRLFIVGIYCWGSGTLAPEDGRVGGSCKCEHPQWKHGGRKQGGACGAYLCPCERFRPVRPVDALAADTESA